MWVPAEGVTQPMEQLQHGRRFFLLVAFGYTLAFWALRERSHSGDWANWLHFLNLGLW